MKSLVQILVLSLVSTSLLMGQFSDNFDDGDISNNPMWLGDVDAYVVNSNGELQLDEEEAGSKFIYLPIEVLADFTWEWDWELNFAPSDNNKGRVYIFLSDIDPSTANGYYLEIGENLANDAIKIFRLDQGSPSLVAECEMGAVAQKPAQVSIKIDRVEGLWTIYTDYTKGGFPIEEIQFFDDTYDFLSSGYFAFEAIYTSSNSKAFFLDNLNGEIFTPDTEGPIITSYEFTSDTRLNIVFNEAISAVSLDNLILGVSPPENDVIDTELAGMQNQILAIDFEMPFPSGPTYELTISGLRDESNNSMAEQTIEFRQAVSPAIGDVIINEILFDPLVGGDDFVEILNISDKLISIEGLTLLNNTKENSEELVSKAIILEPSDIIAFCSDTSILRQTYKTPATARLHEMLIPSFNQSDGNVTIVNVDGEILDDLDYDEDMHLSLIDDTKGVSLERIFGTSPTIASNFTSGTSSTLFATPGYQNANARNSNANNGEIFQLEKSYFSPNNDGDSDQMILLLNMPSTGFFTTVTIFNINGQKVRNLVTNQLTANEDIITWDGSMDDGTKATVGHYLVYIESFTDSGETLQDKKHVKLLDIF